MTPRRTALLLLATILAGACGSGARRSDDRALEREVAPTTTVPTTTTTAPPPPETTTTTAPQPAALTGQEGAKAVVTPGGVVTAVVGAEGAGYKVRTPCGVTAVVSSGVAIREAAVVLDAGHGGDEPGALGPNGLTEKSLNLAVVLHAQTALERAGITTVLTRTGDYRMTLDSRAEVVTALSPKAFVSVHHNAEPDEPWPRPGAETYFQVRSPESKRLAGLLYEEIVKALSQYQVAWVADRDAGTKYRRNTKGDDYYGILRRPKAVPSVLAELGFISNPPEADLYARPDVQQVEGEAVARGIIRYLTTTDPGSGFVEPYPRESPAGSGGGGRGCVDPAL